MKKQYLGLMLCSIITSAHAGDWFGELAFAKGGDEIGGIYVEDWDGDVSEEEISFGDGFTFAFGHVWSPLPMLELQASVCYKEDAIAADNGGVSFKRYPVDGIAFFRHGMFRAGAGLTREMNPKLDLKDVYNFSGGYDDATGRILEVGLIFADAWEVSLRHTDIEFSSNQLVTQDGSNTSLRGAFRF